MRDQMNETRQEQFVQWLRREWCWFISLLFVWLFIVLRYIGCGVSIGCWFLSLWKEYWANEAKPFFSLSFRTSFSFRSSHLFLLLRLPLAFPSFFLSLASVCWSCCIDLFWWNTTKTLCRNCLDWFPSSCAPRWTIHGARSVRTREYGGGEWRSSPKAAVHYHCRVCTFCGMAGVSPFESLLFFYRSIWSWILAYFLSENKKKTKTKEKKK